MNKIIYKFLIMTLVIISSHLSYAQTPASVNWSLMPPDSQNVSSTSGSLLGLAQTSSPGFVVRDYNNGPGPDQRWWPYDSAAVSWGDETEQVNSRWVQFAVHPKSYNNFHVDEISIYIGAKGTNGVMANLYYAFDTSFVGATQLNESSLSLLKDTDSLYTFSMNDDVNNGDTLYVRVYPWYTGSPSTSKYLYLRNATITGTTEALPSPASATWELTNPGDGGTGTTVATAGHVTAKEEYLNNTEINQYSGPNLSQRVRILGNAWPALQTTQLDTVFIQFAVSPKLGVSFTPDSVSLGIAGVSINTMKANIYFSKDSTFATSTMISYESGDTSGNNYLNRDTLTIITASPNLEVLTGETFYLRVYPWVDNDPSVRTGKYLAIQNVVISGIIEGTVIADPPVVETSQIRDISTTFAVSGGNIPTDGGSIVTARGVCWSTSESPTISNNKTIDGGGSGSFESILTPLTAGETYYVRAYATNEAGTAYGSELMFTTLDSNTVPTVVTASASNILVKSAVSGGEVTSWGGDTVSARGVCWNTLGNPNIGDSKTENGSGLGKFTSSIFPLEATTTYYVRAYATNSIGTGYGEIDTFTTQAPAPDVVKIVSKDGTGDHLSVQEAFDAVPDFYTGQYKIFVKKGTYYEKLFLDRNKVNIVLQGEDPDSTILTYDDYAGKAGGTSMSYSVAIDADDFTAIDIVFQNTVVNDGSFNDQQGVALRVNGDRQAYYNCKLLGYQDTYYTWGGRATGRTYMKNCYIEGSVDFIFGRNVVLFDSCEIHINRNGGTLTAASTEPETMFGYVFLDSRITADSIGFNGDPITSFLLGRPWQKSPRTVFINCEEPASLSAAGWSTWNTTPALYAEYKCYGPGADFGNRHAIGRQLTDEEAAEYTIENIFAMSTDPSFGYDWLPVNPLITDVENDLRKVELPTQYELMQNYPNPFNPTTIIKYAIPQTSRVKVSVFNVLGQEVMVLLNEEQIAGLYEIKFDAHNLASGIYLYNIQTEKFVETKKMLLMK